MKPIYKTAIMVSVLAFSVLSGARPSDVEPAMESGSSTSQLLQQRLQDESVKINEILEKIAQQYELISDLERECVAQCSSETKVRAIKKLNEQSLEIAGILLAWNAVRVVLADNSVKFYTRNPGAERFSSKRAMQIHSQDGRTYFTKPWRSVSGVLTLSALAAKIGTSAWLSQAESSDSFAGKLAEQKQVLEALRSDLTVRANKLNDLQKLIELDQDAQAE